jgi:hypothetical protein
MSKHRPIIALVTLQAVAASPAIAMTAPCCCTQRPVETVKACCQEADDAARIASAAPKACSAKQERAPNSVAPPACCCVESTPAVPTSRDDPTAKQTVREATFAVAPLSFAAVAPSCTTNCAEAVAEPPRLSGPRLLALYCIWLK